LPSRPSGRWKKKYAGMGVREVRKLRILQQGNGKLKQLVADLSLDKQMLQDVLREIGQSLLRRGSKQGGCGYYYVALVGSFNARFMEECLNKN
jgi:predicted secreted protein